MTLQQHAAGPSDDAKINWLLGFDGAVWLFDEGYAAKLEISIAEGGPSPAIPHGLRYSFTLHAPGTEGGLGERIYGMDNAHSPDGDDPHDHEHVTKWNAMLPGAPPKAGKATRRHQLSIENAFVIFPQECDEILSRLGLQTGIQKIISLQELEENMKQTRANRN